MLAGNSRYFSFWYEVTEQHGKFHYGPFNIFVDSKLVLGNVEDNFTLNFIAADLSRSIRRMECPDEIPPTFNANEIFERAMHTHGYPTISDPVFSEQWWAQKSGKISDLIDLYIEIEQERRSSEPFGVELPMYSEISDKGWRFFLFGCGAQEILLISKDQGKTISSYKLPKGEVKRAVDQYLEAALIIEEPPSKTELGPVHNFV